MSFTIKILKEWCSCKQRILFTLQSTCLIRSFISSSLNPKFNPSLYNNELYLSIKEPSKELSFLSIWRYIDLLLEELILSENTSILINLQYINKTTKLFCHFSLLKFENVKH